MKPINIKANRVIQLIKLLGAALMISGFLLSSFIQPATATPEDMVTICHAAGQDGTTTFVTLTLSANAVYGQAGHFSEPGTPNAGHEDDYEGPCTVEDPDTTICYLGQTLQVKQSELSEYSGYTEGECETSQKMTICYEGETLEVEEDDLEDYPGYTEGQCVIPDLVTICYFGESLQVERSELDKYPGYNLNRCPNPETVKICYKGTSLTVLVADLEKYPGYNLKKCQVKEEDPVDEPEIEEEEVEPLSIPNETVSGLLIPVTGGDWTGRLFTDKAGFSLIGFGLVLTGIGFAYKGFKKQK